MGSLNLNQVSPEFQGRSGDFRKVCFLEELVFEARSRFQEITVLRGERVRAVVPKRRSGVGLSMTVGKPSGMLGQGFCHGAG